MNYENLLSNPDTVALGYPVIIVGAMGALVLGLVNSFKKEPSPVLIMLYAVNSFCPVRRRASHRQKTSRRS